MGDCVLSDWITSRAIGLEAAIAVFKTALPGWWFSVGECQVSADAAEAAAIAAAAVDATTKANAAQAFSIQRANHTGTQLASTISDFASAVAALFSTVGNAVFRVFSADAAYQAWGTLRSTSALHYFPQDSHARLLCVVS